LIAGCPDGKLPWAKLSRDGSTLNTKYPYVVHAEANCILNAKGSPTLAGAVSLVPQNQNFCHHEQLYAAQQIFEAIPPEQILQSLEEHLV